MAKRKTFDGVNMAKRKTKKSKKRMTRHQKFQRIYRMCILFYLQSLKQHYHEYFKNYTPKDEYYQSEMNKEAARFGIHP